MADVHIGAFARLTGLSRDTVRFYEKSGLLRPRMQANGYRVYDDDDVGRARSIRMAQVLGFTLAEIKLSLVMWEKNALSPARQRTFIENKMRELDEKASQIDVMRRYLQQKLTWLGDGKVGVPPELEAATASPKPDRTSRKRANR